MENGAKNWVFCDGDLPPHGDDPAFYGHEALMITNVTDQDAHIRIRVLYEDKEPYDKITLEVKAQRTSCMHLDVPIGKERYQVPFGQYALHVISDVPVCACFGRLDVRQPNMAYYTVPGVCF